MVAVTNIPAGGCSKARPLPNPFQLSHLVPSKNVSESQSVPGDVGSGFSRQQARTRETGLDKTLV